MAWYRIGSIGTFREMSTYICVLFLGPADRRPWLQREVANTSELHDPQTLTFCLSVEEDGLEARISFYCVNLYVATFGLPGYQTTKAFLPSLPQWS